MDIALVKQKIGDRICLLGNMAPLTVLLEGTPEELDTECKRLIDIGKPMGALFLRPGQVPLGARLRRISML